MGSRRALALGIGVLTACGSGAGTDASGAADSGISPTEDGGSAGDGPTSGTATTTSASATETSSNPSSPTNATIEDPKFDVAPPDINPIPVEEGCAKVDFLFVIDSSNSMATNQGELVASFPEFVAGIQGTLIDVDSFHVGVVTSDAYDPNQPGCTAIGALVTETGGVNSSNAVCHPFADGARYMTEADDLPTAFACAALVGTAGANDEEMMNGATEAISASLNATGACNDGFIRDDALLVTVLISDEDDPGSAGNGSRGNPIAWYNDFIAAKMFPENVVVLTLARGAPGNVCGPAQGSEVDGVRLMQFAQLFGANGFRGDICAASFGPFFEEAIGVIESACDEFVPPP